MHSRTLLFGTIILFGLSTTYPAVSQNPQDRDKAPQTRPASGDKHPNTGGSGNRPQPGRPNPGGSQPGRSGGPQIQPVRPNPGGGNNRPQPSRPNPGGGNHRPQPSRPNPSRPNQGRPPQWGHRPTQRPSYSFRSNDRSYLHRYYLSRLGAINRANRPRFVIGGFFPYAYIPYIQPLPPDLYGYLPPPPPGYAMGYYDGYVVVYDPVTYYIINVVDLML
jgi:hypothetical protein